MTIVNIAAYKFVSLSPDHLPDIRHEFLDLCNRLAIKGTILLSEEGINLMLAGTPSAIAEFKTALAAHAEFTDLFFKENKSDAIPFKRMLVKIKKEIITFGVPDIHPEKFTAPHLSPQELQTWLQEQHDLVLLDTRNDYEIAKGKFKNAVDLNIETFKDFPAASNRLDESLKDKTIVTYCTGGIRCEKAAAYLVQQGFNKVYQLDGGIINYLNQCGNDFYEGNCFVFDERESLNDE